MALIKFDRNFLDFNLYEQLCMSLGRRKALKKRKQQLFFKNVSYY